MRETSRKGGAANRQDDRRSILALATGCLAALALAASCSQLGEIAQTATYAATGDERLAAIAGGAGTAVGGLAPIGYEEEKAIGGAVAVEIVSRFGGVVRNEDLMRYVNLVGNAVAYNSDRPGIEYHFAVLNNSAPNAMATPGGYVFITTGALKSMRDESELAAVLAHEVAHITHRHALEVLQRSRVLQGLSQAGLAALKADPAMFSGLVDETMRTVFDKGLDKSKEYEADRSAVEYLARTGYDPAAMKTYLATLGKLTGYRSSVLFKTHPDPADRIRELGSALQGYREMTGAPRVQSRFLRIKRSVGL